MRWTSLGGGALVFCVFATALGAAASRLSEAVLASPVSSGQAESAQELLRLARVGAGEASLKSIRSISIGTTRGNSDYRHRLMLPDRFQVVHPYGSATLTGLEFWRRPDRAPGSGVFSTGEPEALVARRNTMLECVTTSVAFLRRMPSIPGLTMKVLGPISLEWLGGDGLLVAGPDGLAVSLVFDRSTHQLLGYVRAGQSVTNGRAPVPVRMVTTVGDYRQVDGVMFPHRLELRVGSAPTAETSPLVTTVTAIEVNTLTAADFRRSTDALAARMSHR